MLEHEMAKEVSKNALFMGDVSPCVQTTPFDKRHFSGVQNNVIFIYWLRNLRGGWWNTTKLSICYNALACHIMSGKFFKECLIVISLTTKRRLITSNIDSTTKSFLPFLMKILKISFSSFGSIIRIKCIIILGCI